VLGIESGLSNRSSTPQKFNQNLVRWAPGVPPSLPPAISVGG
jgi:hypothetical protein